MQTRQKRKSILQALVVPAVAAVFLSYFAVHAQTGRYGLEAKEELKQDLARHEVVYAGLLAERHALERRVELLSDGTLERDMIDERIRRSLNMTAADEIAILN